MVHRLGAEMHHGVDFSVLWSGGRGTGGRRCLSLENRFPFLIPEGLLQEANLASIVVQSALYGIFFVLSILALALLYLRQERKQQFRPARGIWTNPLFIASIALLLIVTAVRCALLVVVPTIPLCIG